MKLKDVLDLFMSPQQDMAKICPRIIKEHQLIKGEQKNQLGAIERLEYDNGTYAEVENMTADKTSSIQVYQIKNTDRACFKNVGEITETFTNTPITYAGCLLKQAALDSQSFINPMTLIEWKTELSDAVDSSQLALIRICKLNAINAFQMSLEQNVDSNGKDFSEIVLNQSISVQKYLESGGMPI